jgi:hypothetical protein
MADLRETRVDIQIVMERADGIDSAKAYVRSVGFEVGNPTKITSLREIADIDLMAQAPETFIQKIRDILTAAEGRAKTQWNIQ